MSHSVSCSRFWAMLCHLSSLLGFLLPGASLVVPLIIWRLKRHEDPLIQENGRNVINFVLSFWLYSIILFLIPIAMILLLKEIPLFDFLYAFNLQFFVDFLMLYGKIYFMFHVIFPLYKGIKAFHGGMCPYPLAIPFFKGEDCGEKHCKSSDMCH